MRIIAGSARGRRLMAPRGMATRPTPDRVREALFSILGPQIKGAWVLDLFSGTGALGLESLSRGAGRAVFVDQNRQAIATLEQNLQATGLGEAEVLRLPADRALDRLRGSGRAFDVVFLDPPFEANLLAAALHRVILETIVAPQGVVICEHQKRDEPPAAPADWDRMETRSFGDVALSFYRQKGIQA